MKKHRFAVTAILFALLFTALGCTQVVQVGTTAGQQMGVISAQDKAAIDRTAAAAQSAVRPMTEKEEYYLGRAVAATILSQYRLENNDRLTDYVNRAGRVLAMVSDVPLTYGGYHFAILASDEVNAISCPGGIIFISRGMLDRVANEEELAAVLAHEIAHVNHRDGTKAIKSSRWVEVVTTLGSGLAQKYGPAELAKLTSLFEGSVNDVVKMLVTTGYGKEQEMAADRSALVLMQRMGYDPNGLADYLERLAKEQTAGNKKGFFSTHPAMADRLGVVRENIAGNKWGRIDHRTRDRRFKSYS